MVNGESGKGDRYRPVPKDYGERFDRIFRKGEQEMRTAIVTACDENYRPAHEYGGNMREIKFRAWDLKENKLVDVYQIQWTDGVIDISANGHWHDDIDGRYILEQYTGLKDKNGVEIFEGDIVSYTCETWNEKPFTKRDLVEYRENLCGFNPMCFNLSCDDDYYSYHVTDIEVIGNIHENPEMLK